jgi:DNA repair protein SbcD/Mre11
MRILHTSDWHLGRTLHGLDLRDEQRRVVEQICDLVVTETVDCVVISGDVFDRAIPPVEAVTLFNDAVAAISEHASVIVTAGNHDSAIRLGHGSRFLRPGVHIVTDLESVGSGIDVANRSGDEVVRVYPIPYLDPDHARYVLREDPAAEPLERSHQAVMSAAMNRVKTDLADHPQDNDGRLRVGEVIVAHAFVTGATPSESERDIRVGGVDNIGASLFEDFSYTALGHLHGEQEIPTHGPGIVRYSGSVLRYSFSEASHTKGVVIVDLQAGRQVTHRFLELPQSRGMCQLTGTLEQVLSPALVAAHSDDWIRAVVVDPARPADLHHRVREVYPFALSITHEPVGGFKAFGSTESVVNLTDPVEISQVFIADVTSRQATQGEVVVLTAAYESARSRSAD